MDGVNDSFIDECACELSLGVALELGVLWPLPFPVPFVLSLLVLRFRGEIGDVGAVDGKAKVVS